ncbi:unnamed protein product [Spodoptera exigua]|nr:unnamed protein product [Spodoptera exigua]
MVWCGVATGACLCGGAAAVWGGAGGAVAGGALAGAVFADSAGLQPAPYAMLADAFEYEFRGCAVALVSVAAWAANAVEVVLFPLVARGAGLAAALALAAALTLALAALAALALPETRARSPQQIYAAVCRQPAPSATLDSVACSKETVPTAM